MTTGYDGVMTTSPLTTPTTLAPVADDKNLLTVVESQGSCCGGNGCLADCRLNCALNGSVSRDRGRADLVGGLADQERAHEQRQ